MTLSKDRQFSWWDVIESECYKDDNANFTSPPLGTCELILVENHEVVRHIIFNHSHL